MSTVLLSVLLLGACSAGSEDPDPATGPTRSGADARADLAVLPTRALPDGWRTVPAEERIDGKPGTATYCGVVAEPEDVVEGRIAYYEEASLPRSVLEYAMQTTPEQAERTLAALAAHRGDCVEPGHEVQPVEAAQVDGLGEQAVAWDFVRSDDPSVRFRTVAFRRGDMVVVLVASGQTSVPTREVGRIAREIDRRLVDDGA